MKFDWWFNKEEELKNYPEPWEEFEINLYGKKAGDWTDDDDADRILREIGLHPIDLQDQNERLRAEVERLRGALDEISRTTLAIPATWNDQCSWYEYQIGTCVRIAVAAMRGVEVEP